MVHQMILDFIYIYRIACIFRSCNTYQGYVPSALNLLVSVRLVTQYTYTPDPTILDVKPKWSFVSGGRILSVRGSRLDTVEQPFIAALDDR